MFSASLDELIKHQKSVVEHYQKLCEKYNEVKSKKKESEKLANQRLQDIEKIQIQKAASEKMAK